jgi:hypothetical protein
LELKDSRPAPPDNGGSGKKVAHTSTAIFEKFQTAGRVARGSFTPTPSQVGSRTGAPTVGSGGSSKAFAMALSPAPLVTFPTPATSNAACRFPALRFPGSFAPRVMGPIRPGVLSAAADTESVALKEPQIDSEPPPTPPLPAEAPKFPGLQTPETPGRFSLRLGVYPPSQVLQTAGRFYHVAPASLFDRGTTSQ